MNQQKGTARRSRGRWLAPQPRMVCHPFALSDIAASQLGRNDTHATASGRSEAAALGPAPVTGISKVSSMWKHPAKGTPRLVF